ncbi:MAG TPA: SWIM zinc finger family protein [Candidatus Binatia bacterium]|nr:SWIM zinc finger family protein [Candidatus Binatia bacterium]
MFAQTILAKVDGQRLQKAVHGLVSGAYRVQITLQDGYRVCGAVQNGDGKSYAVTLGSEEFVACNCPDAVYRKAVCKHAVALALYVIRTPHEEHPTEERPVNLKLAKTRPGWVASA